MTFYAIHELENILETFWRHPGDVMEMSWRRLDACLFFKCVIKSCCGVRNSELHQVLPRHLMYQEPSDTSNFFADACCLARRCIFHHFHQLIPLSVRGHRLGFLEGKEGHATCYKS